VVRAGGEADPSATTGFDAGGFAYQGVRDAHPLGKRQVQVL
jgi:hypothetical protein